MNFGDETIPREFSLEAFLKDLDLLKYMIIGEGKGAYGRDWGHTDQGELDSEAIIFGCSDRGYALKRTTHGPDHDGWDFGDIASPSFTTKDGTLYTFACAKYVNKTCHLETNIVNHDSTTSKGNYTLAELRKMLGIPLE
ncbi:MAG: hypothetical protein CO030_02970 [Candidatus Magasanikbacteria bacterium CG_4_9_14_0_2_um_filter_42_11]|uniref:Uncharacterized protein n=1 Tax=Candidatus Magasanikbacteria bacterium CG_4_9_14_0_2_um_filter_42_11 TaxID=1974643 RepID=A0A2M8F9N5_9BACT|nr:MAG: hypothetical protein COU34_02580 [Candidatus Magasanikbacteria bacterium CG10_big_fil_rev_8_21_14_0_10_43_9]PIY92297.1 MAG: hypothetical protein COY70_03990 [Candidatus Magasanikbacteria bacterium CG_4_10_14_0_8_um_filter_42_12]PJC52416.1 MAG: hypothetical protein CO030_02970 [Candidatus Magasanikbacteria bacterium CG_4_9_14_0_2_um_filter_42_11]